jgi:hypothetical protein
MYHKFWAVFLFFSALSVWFFPGWNGFLFESSNVTAGEGRIMAAIFFVGGLLLWYLTPEKKSSKKE